MTPQEFDRFLTQTLGDRRLTGAEKQVLGALLADAHPDEQKLALFRSKAFEAARSSLIDPDALHVLGWLEDVVKALQPHPSGAKPAAAEAYFGPGEDCPRALVRLITGTRRELDVCVFTITDDRIAGPLLEAHRRGVAVRVITDNEKEFDLGSDVERIRQAGVPVRVDRTTCHMHHKFAIFDQERVLTGSYNWTRSAAENNHENLVVSSDAQLVSEFTRAFERLWKELA